MKAHYLFNVWGSTLIVAPVIFLALPVSVTETEGLFLILGVLFGMYCTSLICVFPAILIWAAVLHRVGSSTISEWRKKVILMCCGAALILITLRVTGSVLEFENSLNLSLRLPVCYTGIFLLASALFPLHRK